MPAPLPEAKIDAAVKAYERLRSLRLASRESGVSTPTISKHLKLRGIAMEPSCNRGKIGAAHPAWKGGKEIDRDGYIRLYRPRHPWPRRNGMVLEHVAMMEKSMGRRIDNGECVHHLNHDRQDNRLENLQLMTMSEHTRLHRKLDIHKRRRDENGRFI